MRKRRNRKGGRNNSIWIPFVDLFLLLCLAFLLTPEIEKKESNDTNSHTSPKIFVFLEERDGKYQIKLNGRPVTKNELSKVIKLAVREKVSLVEVTCMGEDEIPNGFVLDVQEVSLSSGIVNENGERILKVVWNNRRLTSHSLKK